MRLPHVNHGSISVAMEGVCHSDGSATERTTVAMVLMSCRPTAVSKVCFQRHVDETTTIQLQQFVFFVCAIFIYLQWQRLVGRVSSAAATASTDVCQSRGTAMARLTVRMEPTREAVVNQTAYCRSDFQILFFFFLLFFALHDKASKKKKSQLIILTKRSWFACKCWIH